MLSLIVVSVLLLLLLMVGPQMVLVRAGSGHGGRCSRMMMGCCHGSSLVVMSGHGRARADRLLRVPRRLARPC